MNIAQFASVLLMLLAALSTQAQTPAPSPTPTAPAAASAVVGDHNTRLADQLPPSQQLTLKAGDDNFAARYIADLSPDHRGSVLILQDSGQHQSWPRTLAALFDQLPQFGWNTLAIELPAPAQDAAAVSTPAATDPKAVLTGSEEGIEKQTQARLDAALAKLVELQQGKPEPTVVIGFGSGAWRAAELARRLAAGNGAKAPEPLRALVLVDPLDRMPATKIDLPALLPATTLPTLDIVQNSAARTQRDVERRRRAVLQQRERIYQQLTLPPLAGDEPAAASVLTRRIRGWIQQHAVVPQP